VCVTRRRLRHIPTSSFGAGQEVAAGGTTAGRTGREEQLAKNEELATGLCDVLAFRGYAPAAVASGDLGNGAVVGKTAARHTSHDSRAKTAPHAAWSPIAAA